jgi:hypothetical protein
MIFLGKITSEGLVGGGLADGGLAGSGVAAGGVASGGVGDGEVAAGGVAARGVAVVGVIGVQGVRNPKQVCPEGHCESRPKGQRVPQPELAAAQDVPHLLLVLGLAGLLGGGPEGRLTVDPAEAKF